MNCSSLSTINYSGTEAEWKAINKMEPIIAIHSDDEQKEIIYNFKK